MSAQMKFTREDRNAMRRLNTIERRKNRREAAELRQAERNNRTAGEQLTRLIDAGHGECREAKRLMAKVMIDAVEADDNA